MRAVLVSLLFKQYAIRVRHLADHCDRKSAGLPSSDKGRYSGKPVAGCADVDSAKSKASGTVV